MIEHRYLVITLIAVFLALAVGLMIGTALGGPDRRDAVYEGLRRDFDLLRTENERVQEVTETTRRRRQADDQALRELLPLAVRDRLSGAEVAIVVCGPLDEGRFRTDLEAALDDAGARVGPLVRITDRLRPLAAEDRAKLAPIWERAAPSGDPQPFEAASWLIRALARGGPRDRIQELARAAGITIEGGVESPVRRLLVLTQASEERQALLQAGRVPEMRIVDVAREEGIEVVAAEPEDPAVSAVEVLRRRGITTVDNVDTAAGQISVVLALAGAEGQFGAKPGATRAIPALQSR